MELAVSRGFGGTSWLWGGRCVTFDDIDFESRPYIPDSGWPITHADVKPWYRQATEYLGCGIDQFVWCAPNWSLGGVLADRLTRWSQEPKRGLVYRDEIASRPRISLRLNSMVTGLDLGSDGMLVEGVLVGSTNPSLVRARSYVLACGGLETTRLLLSTQRK
jgi:choline dehydrogenase-like flavoprotein